MRLAPVVATALVFAMSGSAFAQEYVLYVSKDDRFRTMLGRPATARKNVPRECDNG